jgi:hypothetical protein
MANEAPLKIINTWRDHFDQKLYLKKAVKKPESIILRLLEFEC